MERDELKDYYERIIQRNPDKSERPYTPEGMVGILNASQELYFVLRQLYESHMLEHKNLKVMDIGCGYGRHLGIFIHQAGSHPKDCIGIEPIREWFNYSKKVLPEGVNLFNILIQETIIDNELIKELNVLKGKIDIVFIRGVFCLLSDSERKYLASFIDKIIKPQGYVIIIEHNVYAPLAWGVNFKNLIKSLFPKRILYFIKKYFKQKHNDTEINLYDQDFIDIFGKENYRISRIFSFGLNTNLKFLNYLDNHPFLINLIALMPFFHCWRLITIRKTL